MALGDLITADYQVEYNGLLLGPGTQYYLYDINNLLGFSSRSQTTTRFGRHGGVSGRHYAMVKNISIAGELVCTTDADFYAKRLALGSAFAPVVNPDDAPYIAFRLPDGSSGLLLRRECRATGLDVPLTPDFGRKHPDFTVNLEMPNPILEGLTQQSQAFTASSDTQTLANDGNAPAAWVATLVGPATNPILTNDDTGQSISFSSLVVGSSETLIYDSFSSRITLEGDAVNLSLASGFSWWDLQPGDNDISISATGAGSATFSITWHDSYWIG